MRLHRTHILLTVILGLSIMPACDDPFEHAKCRWRITLSEQVSPDQLYKASVEGWACEQKPDKTTMTRVVVYRADGSIPSEEFFRRDGKQSIKLSWLTARHLLVECEGTPAGEENPTDHSWGDLSVSLKCPRLRHQEAR